MPKAKNTHLFLFVLSLVGTLINLVLIIRDHEQDRMDLFIRITSILLLLYFCIDHFLSWKNLGKQNAELSK